MGLRPGVSVVKLYAGAFFPGIMLAGLYIGYVIIVAKLKPKLAPPLSAEGRKVAVPAATLAAVGSPTRNAVAGLLAAIKARGDKPLDRQHLRRQWLTILLPAIAFSVILGLSWNSITKPDVVDDTSGLQQTGQEKSSNAAESRDRAGDVAEPPVSDVKEPPSSDVKEPPSSDVKEPPSDDVKEPPSGDVKEPPGDVKAPPSTDAKAALPEPGKSTVKTAPAEAAKTPPAAVAEARQSHARLVLDHARCVHDLADGAVHHAHV